MKSKIFMILFLIVSINISIAQDGDNFRKNIDVTHYDINLNITNFKDKIISGNTVLQITPLVKKIKSISLDFAGLKVDSVMVDNKRRSIFSHSNEILSFPLKKSAKSGDTLLVDIYYHGTPEANDSWGGFFFTDSAAFNMGVGMTAKPHSYGRIWYPCIDSFTDKATYNFNITVPAGFTAVCSGILINSEKNNNKTETFHWEIKQEIPSYLTSVAVGKYSLFEKHYKGKKREFPIDIYVKETLLKDVEASFVNVEKAVSTFEEHYGDYRWDRVGYVSVPFKSGAMEHACNIAYPEYAVNGTRERETLMAHELSHSWFGNLVTCRTPEDMWLNEGWASFSEALFKESVYGKEAYKEYVRENHEKVLKLTHIYDNGYRAVYGIPHKYTYGSTVYDKGADVAHTLRGYMGDSLFFSSLTAYLKKFAFKTAATYEFRDFLSEYSGVNVSDFFDTWVFTPGFPYFYVDKFWMKKSKKEFIAFVHIKQELKERAWLGKNNKAELYFFDKNLNKTVKTITFSGLETVSTFHLPFKPENVFIDLEEKISDVTIDNYKIISSIGTYAFPNTEFSAEITEISDSILIRSSLNYINAKSANRDFNINETLFWNISGVNTESVSAQGKFYINNVENNFPLPIDETTLFYRENASSAWRELNFQKEIINKYEAYFIVPDLMFGDYVTGEKIKK